MVPLPSPIHSATTKRYAPAECSAHQIPANNPKYKQISLDKEILVFQLLQLEGQFIHRFRDFGDVQLFGNNRQSSIHVACRIQKQIVNTLRKIQLPFLGTNVTVEVGNTDLSSLVLALPHHSNAPVLTNSMFAWTRRNINWQDRSKSSPSFVSLNNFSNKGMASFHAFCFSNKVATPSKAEISEGRNSRIS